MTQSLDESIDPELDAMLAELETDEDFKKLSDNDQLTWLESLFYLDTPTKMASSKLVKPKPATEELMPRRREKTALSLYSKGNQEETDSSGDVSAKTFAVQGAKRTSSAAATKQAVQNMTKSSPPRSSIPATVPVPATPMPVVPATVEEGFSSTAAAAANREADGVNKDLCSLAQSFFSEKPRKPPQRRVSTNTQPVTQRGGGMDSSSCGSRKSFPPPARERAFFQPEQDEMVDE